MTNPCACCFDAVVDACAQLLVLNTQLEAGEYELRLTDKFNIVYTQQFIVAENETAIPIIMDDWPPALINQFAGVFRAEIFRENNCSPIAFTLRPAQSSALTQYTCMNIEAQQHYPSSQIGCPIS